MSVEEYLADNCIFLISEYFLFSCILVGISNEDQPLVAVHSFCLGSDNSSERAPCRENNYKKYGEQDQYKQIVACALRQKIVEQHYHEITERTNGSADECGYEFPDSRFEINPYIVAG